MLKKNKYVLLNYTLRLYFEKLYSACWIFAQFLLKNNIFLLLSLLAHVCCEWFLRKDLDFSVGLLEMPGSFNFDLSAYRI